MSTLELEHLKHSSSSSNNLSVHSDGSLTLGTIAGQINTTHNTISVTNSSYPQLQLNSGVKNYHIFNDTGSNSLYFKNATDNVNAVIVDSVGRVSHPQQVDFHATGGTVGLGSSTKITFTSIRRNNGSHYSTALSRFTAPVAGRYFFVCNLVFNNLGANSVRVSEMGFKVNGSSDYGFTSLSLENWNSSNEHPSLNFSDIIYMNVNDYVEVQTFTHWDSSGGTFETRNGRTSFGGYFIG